MNTKKWNYTAVGLASVCGCVLLYFVYSMSSGSKTFAKPYNALKFSDGRKEMSPAFEFSIWPPFQTPPNEQEWFQEHCLESKTEFSIANLHRILHLWSKSMDLTCKQLLQTFTTIYDVSTRNATLNLPEPFQPKVLKWLGNDQTLFKEVYNQKTIHIVNRFTREQTIFNPLRDKRPHLPPDVPEDEYVNNILKETEKNCDFCNYKSYTAEHVFHRIENEYAFTASNTFKMDTLHALFALKQHNPIEWTPKAFMGLMDLSVQWFHKAHEVMPSARFPVVIWDVLPKCGASQVHPHLHGFMDPERYPGVVGAWRLGAQDYFRQQRTNFYTDMAKLSSAFGLTAHHKSAIAFASMVPRKDHEVVIMAPVAGRDFFEMIYFVLRGLIDDVHVHCFSMGIAYPALNGVEGVIPAYARIITRGVISDIRTDISSLELFAATNVNIDPWEVTKMIRNSIEKRHSTI